jgi:hypothetical protein
MPVSMLSTSLITNPRKYGRFNALDTIYTPPTDSFPGMVLVKPTSITHSGTSATLGANGQVTFSAVTSLSLNGVFTADFDNYMMVIRGIASTLTNIPYRLRASGSDASGNNYTTQRLSAENTSIEGTRTTATNAATSTLNSTSENSGFIMYFYGPFLAQSTATRTVSARGTSGAAIFDNASTHSLSTSYDGFSLLPDLANLTGALQVYGLRS